MIVIRNAGVRRVLRIVLPLIGIPGTVFVGALLFREKHYLPLSFLVAILSLLLFLAGFEQKKTGSRRAVIVAVMVALSVAGRFIPLFKPVTALTVLTAVYFGGEAGFLTGSLSALISNLYFGQGPWTPFQMLGWGLIGLLAGLLRKPLKHRIPLCIYGLFAGIAFSGVMDVWTVLYSTGGFTPSLYTAALVTAIPHTVLYSLSNLLFLWFFSRPIGEKLERISIKYGV